MQTREALYRASFDTPDAYAGEPTDAQANVLLRALAHWTAAYADPDATAKEIAREILDLNALSTDGLTRDEAVSIANVFHLEV